MSTGAVPREAWPAWAKALLAAVFVLAILVLVPWVFMWTTMAASCVPMMNGMHGVNGVMGPGMMR